MRYAAGELGHSHPLANLGDTAAHIPSTEEASTLDHARRHHGLSRPVETHSVIDVKALAAGYSSWASNNPQEGQERCLARSRGGDGGYRELSLAFLTLLPSCCACASIEMLILPNRMKRGHGLVPALVR